MLLRPSIGGLLLCGCMSASTTAAEPNEDPFQATVLPPGTLSVFDEIVIRPFASDVDFFTFTDLTPGQPFAAETLSDGDTLLGWFEGFVLLDYNDDRAEGDLTSFLTGIVPGNGQLTFGVTSFNDSNFIGEHTDAFSYELRVTAGSASLPADFNKDTVVDAADLTVWEANFGTSAGGDADGDSDTDGADFLIWQEQIGGSTSTSAFGISVTAIPEPAAVILAVSSLVGVSLVGRRSRNRNR